MYWIGFGQSTFIIMTDKTVKRVDLLQSGDQVSCGDNRFATVHKIVSVDSEQEFQMCNYFGVLLTARSIIKNENNDWEYCCELMDSSQHSTCRTIVQIELESIQEIECQADDDKKIICMTKNHEYDRLIYDAVLTDEIENSDRCSCCGDTCIIDGKVFSSRCSTIDYCARCVPIIHMAVDKTNQKNRKRKIEREK
jgi:hypothetical protein